MDSVLIVAAEASSSLYAQRLMEFWQQQNKKVHCFGVGSNDMEKLGFERFGKSEEMAVVGLSEVLAHYSHIKSVFHTLVAEAEKRKPKVVILMDYPGFNLKFAKEMHRLGIPCVYYISPQVWAWKQGRVEIIRKYIHKMFVIFPFELEFFQKKNIPVEFVGHPLLDELKDKYFTPEYREIHRSRCGIQNNDFVLGLMPGSRMSELKFLSDLQIATAQKIYKNHKNIKILVLTAPTVEKELIQDTFAKLGVPHIIQKDDPFEMIHLCDGILAASGTATLIVGLLKKPMVVMYKMNPLSMWFFKLVVRGIKYITLPNIIMDREVVPERLQGDANPEELYRLMKKFIEDPVYYQTTQTDLGKLHHLLGEKGATARVAKGLEEYFQ